MRYIIIGGTSGIGLAAATMAVEAGHSVLAAGRDMGKFPDAQAAGAATAQIDASDPESVQRFFAEHGEFDHLVLSVSGASGAGNFRELDIGELRKGFEGKFWPQVACAKAALATLRPGGSITFVGAISSRALKPGTAGLAAINAALEAMVPILASELRPTRVNAVVPGVVDTPWWSRVPEAAKAELFEKLASEVPVGRVGKPEDLASAIMFVTTNTFITGSIIDCDGGWKLKNP
ncbi:SDR family oxidoreductase [Duganella sp. Root1480D1]|uniref:SDR family oxidoreductase n=1 Tax=Duganella sp. Root1480D1 TaxID=1736471 RepID=UPI000708D5FB|nr:SDR family oxidoreductase [Duganella sp. Root1480D1]KQZ30499.1 short-chain dehydrogenase [Duganella sp. Root1480D1]